ncbi:MULTISPECIES: Na(+)-translocating NADH-quinone reductase subunit C [unclassified Colwellia]|uniref:Na(+)-translocating NADH-quinone reductase subunit C n=1 Tax=unclassified Colwellia TaxID=196834 RepID=UPI0015F47E29|nr:MULTISPECIES: Na(+)-translocating NADH-quinone reductase subunit C [unclassified Colwellia]MBA6362998.1 Na(+)-translocating NADH-quinone reductase subunit C [Colwellia sp. BRX8-8]MBA6347699.1 Na(+)-translocating NADH-quinone reductase subunit C [Colwellia sp. BRX8-9]MBA6353878.1 Na(+)-translocating NADH-quinone reductase subunit C [Colwellia sp. BRX9-1]MBA6357379.1 Na(+)-translocating NADH-quinone reductase subunit C [Colwellia sp. BRX8-3]MBA6360417.1 Na(+)-translocating NADH-quinone reduct
MSSNKETPIKTIGFVFLVCLVCAALVSVAAISLKPLQQANKLLDKQTKILEASGLLEKAGTDIVGTYNKYVVAKMIDLDSGKIIEGNTDIFDERADARDAAKSSKLTNDTAGINRRANRAVVYLVNNEQGQLNTLVLPIVGSGLWDLMYGYIGLAPDLNTVRSLIYSDLKETPGLGAEVLNPKWKALWPGKKIYNDSDEVAIKVIKGGAKAGDVHGVDALSGATLTSNGVQNTLHFWLGEQGYGPFITKYRSVASEGEMN